MEKDGQRLTLWGCAALWGSCDHPDEMERSLEGGMQREAEGSGEGRGVSILSVFHTVPRELAALRDQLSPFAYSQGTHNPCKSRGHTRPRRCCFSFPVPRPLPHEWKEIFKVLCLTRGIRGSKSKPQPSRRGGRFLMFSWWS